MTTTLIVLAIVLFIGALVTGYMSAAGVSGGAEKAYIGVWGGVAVACLAGAIACIIASMNVSAANLEDTGSADGGGTETSVTTSVVTTAATEPEVKTEESKEEFEGRPFYVDLDDEDLWTWMERKMGDEIDLYKLAEHYSNACFPSQRDFRVASAREAGALWYNDPKYLGFSDPVWYAMKSEVITAARDGKLPKDYVELENYLDKEVQLPIYKEILVNPVYMDMYAQWLYAYSDEFPEILDEAPWLKEFLDKMDEYYARTEAPVGIQNLFEEKENKSDPNILSHDNYMLYAAKLIYVMDHFDWDLEKPVRKITSSVSWHLPICGSANLCRTVKITEEKFQESEPVVMLVIRYKSGHTALRSGVNMFDQRVEIFTPTDPQPTPPPTETVTTTTPVVTTVTTPKPKEYTLTYIHVDGDTGETLPTSIVKDRVYKVKKGTKCNDTGEDLSKYGYEGPYPASYSFTMPGEDVLKVYTYYKKYTVTYTHIDGDTGKKIPESIVKDRKYKARKGSKQNDTGEDLSKYGYDGPYPASYSFTMPGKNVTKVYKYYKKTTTITITIPDPDPVPPGPDPSENDPPKDPSKTNGNIPGHPGGDRPASDGTGDYQPTDPGANDTPENPGDGSTTSGGGGNGGGNTPVTDPNGGNTDGGTPPETDPIPTHTDTVADDPSGGTSKPSEEWPDTPIGEPT